MGLKNTFVFFKKQQQIYVIIYYISYDPWYIKLFGVWRKGNPLTLLVGMQTSTATMENSVEIPLKTGNRTALWPSNPTAGLTHRGNQNWKRHMYPSVHCSTVYNSQDMEAT